ncbi:MAG: hypothetical protein EBU81_13575, partial [Proteobacteria bacterium]|nr:hypothetical protein [Pseudomonadota bacterium]
AAIFGSVTGIDTVKPATEAHAQAAGWIWQIPTVGRVGSGQTAGCLPSRPNGRWSLGLPDSTPTTTSRSSFLR